MGLTCPPPPRCGRPGRSPDTRGHPSAHQSLAFGSRGPSRGAHAGLEEEAPSDVIEAQVPLQLQKRDQLREEGLEPLRTDVRGRLPGHQQGLLEL
jgi:hypothetical protein